MADLQLDVRVVGLKDRDAIKDLEELEREAFGRGALNVWGLVPAIAEGRVVVARAPDGQIVAWAILWRRWAAERLEAYLFSFAVRAGRRGEGIGQAFLARLLDILAREGVARVELTVSPLNLTAMHIYIEKFGFERVGVIPECYGPGEDRFILARDMPPPP